MNFRNTTSNGVLNLTINHDTIEEDQEKAEAIAEAEADYLSQVFTRESLLPIGSALAASEEQVTDSVDVDKDIVPNCLMKLDADKSMGPDNLHPKLNHQGAISTHIWPIDYDLY
ncbi:unnamed protein product [Trichobilharzia regenti]|nr:unnamed protein product [Trichobilharzia regenti]